MASILTHVVAAGALGTALAPRGTGWRLAALGALCAVLPDAYVIGLRLGIRYEDMLGHRGLSHSLAFAACLAGLATWWFVRGGAVPRGRAARMAAFLFVATASHGVLDAMTDGGLGVAFLAPFSGERYFLPWRPIVVSPLSFRRFLSGRGLEVVTSEILAVWVPSAVVAMGALLWRRRRGAPRVPDAAAGGD